MSNLFADDNELEQEDPRAGGNPYLVDTERAFRLLLSLVDAHRDSQPSETEPVYKALVDLLKQDFLQRESDYPKAAAEGVIIDYELDRLGEVVAEKGLVRRQTVAIGGAFSTGKSAFLNSMVGIHSLLPVNLRPTTAIPTLLLHGDHQGESERIFAENAFGRRTRIDREALQAICHDFNSRYGGVVLNQLVRRISIELPGFRYRNLAMIDTPGYSKADLAGEDDDRYRDVKSDEEVARTQLASASHVFWMADAERGHLSGTDMDFLQSLGEGKPVTVIFNKADLKPPAEREKILATAREVLESRGINFGGRLYLFSSADPAASQRAEIEKILEELDKERVVVDWALPVLEALDRYAEYYRKAAAMYRDRGVAVTRAKFVEMPDDDRVKAMLSELQQECTQKASSYAKQAADVESLRADVVRKYRDLGSKLNLTFTVEPPIDGQGAFPGDAAFERNYGRLIARRAAPGGVLCDFLDNATGTVKTVRFRAAAGDGKAADGIAALFSSSESELFRRRKQADTLPQQPADFFRALDGLKKKR